MLMNIYDMCDDWFNDENDLNDQIMINQMMLNDDDECWLNHWNWFS